jgi:hypothetical protein
MKLQHLIPILFLAAFCTVSAQTNNAPASTNKPPLLTTNQAVTLAMQLASDKWNKDYSGRGQSQFVAGTLRFTAGHWLLVATQGFGKGDIQAKVELAPDGSTNSVILELLDNRIIIP